MPEVGEIELMIWGIALTLFALWLLGVLLGNGGFIHIVLLCAVAVAVVQWMAEHRARQG
jgi:hypothetical protein